MINAAQAQSSYYYDGGIDYNNNNYYKSEKDNSKKSVNINKIKCINTNFNINGNNTGDVNIGNKRQGYSGANSYGSERYYDGYDNNKQGKGFDDCIISNNNTNTNINIVSGGGNQTIPPDTITCEECFEENLTPEQLAGVNAVFAGNIINDPITGTDIFMSLELLCGLWTVLSEDQISLDITTILESANQPLPPERDIPEPIFEEIIQCVLEALENE